VNSIQKRRTSPVANSELAGDQRGLTTVEYVIVLVLIAVVGIGVWRIFGTAVKDKITTATTAVQGL
jgi:Flp pilus assembly pilin Flp